MRDPSQAFARSETCLTRNRTAHRKIRSPFSSLSVSTRHYTAVLDALSPETYILVVAKGHMREFGKLAESVQRLMRSFVSAETAALELNIRLARPHFATLEAIGMGRS